MRPYAPYPLNLVRDWSEAKRWRIRLVLVVVLLPWLSRFVYVRWTTTPPARYDYSVVDVIDAGLVIPPQGLDRTKDFVGAVNRLPTVPALTPPQSAPAGMMWLDPSNPESPDTTSRPANPIPASSSPARSYPLRFEAALQGNWTPQSRHSLAIIVGYLRLKGTENAIVEIRALSNQPLCLMQSRTFGADPMGQVLEMKNLLLAHARYCMAGNNDFDTALSDLQAVLDLSDGIADGQTAIALRIAHAMRRGVSREAVCWAREFQLAPSQINRLQGLLLRHRPDPVEPIRIALRGDQLIARYELDRMYTSDAAGDGWYVPGYGQLGDGHSRPSLRFCSLLSFPFADRRRAESTLTEYWSDMIRDAGRTSPDTACARLCLNCGAAFWHPVLPCITRQRSRLASELRSSHLSSLVEIDGAIISLGLEQYRNHVGYYPDSLEALVPRYAPDLPDDPFGKGPLKYRVDDNEGFVLYSVYKNGRDDYGAESGGHDQIDLRLSWERPEAVSLEWVLVARSKGP